MHREERLADPGNNPRLRAAQDHTWTWSDASGAAPSAAVPTFDTLGPFAKVGCTALPLGRDGTHVGGCGGGGFSYGVLMTLQVFPSSSTQCNKGLQGGCVCQAGMLGVLRRRVVWAKQRGRWGCTRSRWINLHTRPVHVSPGQTLYIEIHPQLGGWWAQVLQKEESKAVNKSPTAPTSTAGFGPGTNSRRHEPPARRRDIQQVG
jgi:hypothetical protein